MSFSKKQGSVPPPRATRQPTPPASSAPPRAPDTSDPYALVGQIDVAGRNRKAYLLQGTFTGEVVQVFDGFAQRRRLHFFGATLRVTTSSNPAVQPGALIDWTTFQNLSYPEMFAGNIQKFLAALQAVEPNDVTLEEVRESTAEGQPYAGCSVAWETYQHDEKDYTVTRFYPTEPIQGGDQFPQFPL